MARGNSYLFTGTSVLVCTVEAPLTNTIVSVQLYLWPPSQNPVLLNSHTSSVFSLSQTSEAGSFFCAPRVSTYESFDCNGMCVIVRCPYDSVVNKWVLSFFVLGHSFLTRGGPQMFKTDQTNEGLNQWTW